MGTENAAAESQSGVRAEIQSAHEVADLPKMAVPKVVVPVPVRPPVELPLSTKEEAAANDTANKGTWNTKNLGRRIGVDAMAAASAGLLVAPIITMIDKGIIENASGRNTLGDSLKKSAKELLLRPHRFLTSKPFALIFVRVPFLPSNPTTQNTP